MEEHQVTIDGRTSVLPEPFFVLATQNPIELEGTFPLPEAQLDRFLIRVTLGYPNVDDEHAILLGFEDDDPFSRLSPVITAEEVIGLQHQRGQVIVSDAVRSLANHDEGSAVLVARREVVEHGGAQRVFATGQRACLEPARPGVSG